MAKIKGWEREFPGTNKQSWFNKNRDGSYNYITVSKGYSNVNKYDIVYSIENRNSILNQFTLASVNTKTEAVSYAQKYMRSNPNG